MYSRASLGRTLLPLSCVCSLCSSLARAPYVASFLPTRRSLLRSLAPVQLLATGSTREAVVARNSGTLVRTSSTRIRCIYRIPKLVNMHVPFFMVTLKVHSDHGLQSAITPFRWIGSVVVRGSRHQLDSARSSLPENHQVSECFLYCYARRVWNWLTVDSSRK